MKRYVLDSYALIAYFNGLESGKPVIDILKKTVDGGAETFMSVLNFGELYYITLREDGSAKAESCLKLLSQYPIEIVDIQKYLTLEAAKIKADGKMCYINAFTAALVKYKKAELVTGDKEFKALEKNTHITWI